MPLEKAIQGLFDLAHEDVALEHSHYRDALKLGIEALKNKLEARRHGHAYSSGLLPGETEE